MQRLKKILNKILKDFERSDQYIKYKTEKL